MEGGEEGSHSQEPQQLVLADDKEVVKRKKNMEGEEKQVVKRTKYMQEGEEGYQLDDDDKALPIHLRRKLETLIAESEREKIEFRSWRKALLMKCKERDEKILGRSFSTLRPDLQKLFWADLD